jgi:hypothetical protein
MTIVFSTGTGFAGAFLSAFTIFQLLCEKLIESSGTWPAGVI